MGPTKLDTIEPVYFPRGVAASDGSAGFSADGLGGVVAVGPANGALLWQTMLASLPLIVLGDRVIAAQSDADRPGSLRIIVLDAARGGQPLLVSDPVELPAWASGSGYGPDGLAFDARAQGNDLFVAWEARASYRGGAAPSAYVQSRAEHHATGVVAVDLTQGHVRSVQDESLVQLFRFDASPRRLGFDPSADPWQAGSQRALLTWDVVDSDLALYLELSDLAGAGARRTLLVRGRGVVARVTPDGRFVFVHEEQPGPRTGVWQMFSAEAGAQVATLTYERDASSPCVLGDRVYYLVTAGPNSETPHHVTLRAREIATDRLLWGLPMPEPPHMRRPPLRQ